jgi:hypothetical protein
MLKVKARLVAPALMVLGGFALVGCSGSDNHKNGSSAPPPPPQVAATAKFNLSTYELPYPADPFFFLGSTDGTLNLPTVPFRPAAMQSALNALDGWSTSASLWTGFTLPLDPTSLSASTVKIVKVYLNATNKAPVDVTDAAQVAAYLPDGWPLAQGPIAGVLAYGTDYTASVDDSIDSGGMTLRITPLKPFDPSSGPAVTGGKIFNIGYIVILTDGIKAATGQAMGSDTLYASIKSAPADCSTISDATSQQVCQFTKPQLSIAQAIGVDPASVILSWSFSTQSIDDTFAYISATGSAQPTLVVPAFNAALGRILTTSDANASLQGKADIYLGSTVLPYYLTATDGTQTLAQQNAAVNLSFWKAASPPPAPLADPAGQGFSHLSMFNPVPLKTTDVTVPILVTVPRIGAGAGYSQCAGMPPDGWPVAIVQHGITGNRSQALAMADGFADQCFIVVSMDLPLHGITATSATDPLTAFHCFAPPAAANPACLGAVERTFDVDLAAPAGPDSSGAYFINLSNPLTGRDNLRQAEADLIQLVKSIPGLTVAAAAPGSLPAAPVSIDASRISFVGLSLGSIVGGSFAQYSSETSTVALSVPGGVVTQLLLDSQTFGPSISAALAAQGLTPGGSLFNQYFRDFQAVVDGGDPINHIRGTQDAHPTLLFKVLNDTVVPNNSTDRLITAGGLTKLTTAGNNPVGAGAGAWSFFKVGSHGTLFDPTTSLLATMEMQTQAIGFSASAALPGGPFVPVGLVSTDVLDLN